MKVYLIILFSIISITGISAQASIKEALKEYQEGDYSQAITLFEEIIKKEQDRGQVSSELYYNLGNAYFRKNEVSRAILNYERALKIDPQDKDIIYNLKFANEKIEDKINLKEFSFIKMGLHSVKDLFSSNAWAKASIFFFIVFISSLVLYLFSSKMLLKKIGFYVAIVLFCMLIFTNIFSYTNKEDLLTRENGIIMSPIVDVMSSPSNNVANKIFTLHEGTKVNIKRIDANWVEIEIASGNIGWIELSKIEII